VLGYEIRLCTSDRNFSATGVLRRTTERRHQFYFSRNDVTLGVLRDRGPESGGVPGFCCQMLPNVAKCCQVLPNVAKCCQMLPSVAKCCQMLPNVAKCCQNTWNTPDSGPRSRSSPLVTSFHERLNHGRPSVVRHIMPVALKCASILKRRHRFFFRRKLRPSSFTYA